MKGIGLILFITVGVEFLITFLGMLLWNGFMPDLFGAPSLTFWQAFGIRLLCDLFSFSPSVNKEKNK